MSKAVGYFYGISLLAVSAVGPVQALPPHKASHAGVNRDANATVCATLSADYEEASKKLSLTKAEGTGDDSVARSQKRAAQDNAVLAHATMTMNLMGAHGCKLPSQAPSPDRYSIAAIMCALKEDVNAAAEQADEAEANYPGASAPSRTYSAPECDMDKWKPNQGQS